MSTWHSSGILHCIPDGSGAASSGWPGGVVGMEGDAPSATRSPSPLLGMHQHVVASGEWMQKSAVPAPAVEAHPPPPPSW